MKKTPGIFKLFLLSAVHLCCIPAQGQKAYQKIYLNDAEMELAPKKAEKFEMNFQVYREGASGANGGKTGGGCGCNLVYSHLLSDRLIN